MAWQRWRTTWTFTGAQQAETRAQGLAPRRASQPRGPLRSRRLLRETGQHMKIPHIDEDRFDVEYPADYEGGSMDEPSSSGTGCPVYVMLPLDTVWVVERDGKRISVLKKERSLDIALHTLKQAGVEGVMVDIWWGIVERQGPRQYDFTAYKRLFYKVAAAGLKVQAVMSFHAAGGNVGDTCKIPLPKWVLEVGERNPDVFYTDKAGHRNRECLSLGCDEQSLFWGRAPVHMYRDFINAFADKFQHLFGERLSRARSCTAANSAPARAWLPSLAALTSCAAA
jgi:beta-amylase